VPSPRHEKSPASQVALGVGFGRRSRPGGDPSFPCDPDRLVWPHPLSQGEDVFLFQLHQEPVITHPAIALNAANETVAVVINLDDRLLAVRAAFIRGQLLTAEEGQNGPRLVKRREAVVDQARVVEVGS
jgi:hypothetical protein